jgi:hypothetical protein
MSLGSTIEATLHEGLCGMAAACITLFIILLAHGDGYAIHYGIGAT